MCILALIDNIKDKLDQHRHKDWFIFLDKFFHGIFEDEVPAVGGQLTYFF